MNQTKRFIISRSEATRNPHNEPWQRISIRMPHLPDLSDRGLASWEFGMTLEITGCLARTNVNFKFLE
jgi:hypothetical protein